jgi:hypothetical protein
MSNPLTGKIISIPDIDDLIREDIPKQPNINKKTLREDIPQQQTNNKPRITRRTLTLMEKYNVSMLIFEDAEKGYKLYNPVKNIYVKNTSKNKLSIKKQIEDYNKKLLNKLTMENLTIYTPTPTRPERIQKVIVKEPRSAIRNQRNNAIFNIIKFDNPTNMAQFGFIEDETVINAINNRIKSMLKKIGQLHITMVANTRFYLPSLDTERTRKKPDNPDFKFVTEGEDTFLDMPISSKSNNILSVDDINVVTDTMRTQIKASIESTALKGSGFALERINYIDLNISSYKPLSGSSYVELPKFIQNKKACINVQNKDNKCFQWAVLSGLHPTEKDAYRTSKYTEYIENYNWEDIQFPTAINNISKFEKNNNVSINVYTIDKYNNIIPIKFCKIILEKHINLLLIKTLDENYHYCWIKDFDKLTNKQNSNHKCKTYTCFRCQHHCTSQTILDKHNEWCSKITDSKDGKIEMPKEGSFMEFKNYYNKFKAPFVIYGDFEAILPNSIGVNRSPKLTQNQNHKPCGFCLYVVSAFESIQYEPIVYRGSDCMDIFHKTLKNISIDIKEKLKTNKPLEMSKFDKKIFNNSTHCHICEQELGSDRVRDHCHMTGQFRGAAHNECNINFNYGDYKIPLLIHNLKNYDAHFIISTIPKEMNNIDVIANNSEKFITFTIGNIRFIDSFQFLSAGLETLASNLAKGGIEKFYHTKKHMGEHWKLACQKGIYPYEYMDSFERFDESKLPPIEKFYSSLNESSVSKDEYKHAINVFNTLKMSNLGQYHDFYLKTDVLLLADIFETFRNTIHNTHKLEPVYYFTLPSYSWDAMLYKTKVKFELLHDYEMYCMIEKGIRGGISVISHRYAKANNKYMKNYNKNDIESYITYLDANNLYGLAMSMHLPIDCLKWLNVENFNLDNMNSNKNIGYILEVDLEYPAELHKLHNDYPLAPENIEIKSEFLSEWQKQQSQTIKKLSKELNDKLYNKTIKDNKNQKQEPENGGIKLCPNLMNKTKYIVHSKNLEYYLKKGLKLTKIHRIIQFNQSLWLKQYIDMNTDLRNKAKKAKNDFEKDLYKLMNNSIFGKTMENVRGKIDLELVNNFKRANSITKSPLFNSFHIINKDLVGVISNRKSTQFNKPIYAGFSILELSKLHMFSFHYDFIKPKYGENAKLLMTDTDSLVYHIKTEDFYMDCKENIEHFDTSGFPKEHFLYHEIDDTVLGKFKHETNDLPITEFIGIRSKLYSMKLDDGDEKFVAKGIKKSYKKSHITHENYRKCIMNEEIQQTATFQLIRPKCHELSTYTITKNSLVNYDDKRFISQDGISTLAHGYKAI